MRFNVKLTNYTSWYPICQVRRKMGAEMMAEFLIFLDMHMRI